MKYYECVSQYAVNLILEPFTKRAQSVRIRTDSTLDQDCVLKATVQVCTSCMIVSLLTTCMNFNTPPLAQVAPFRCKIRESNAEVTLDTKLSKYVCQLILVCRQLNVSKPVNSILTIPECRSDHHGSCIVAHHGPDKAILFLLDTDILRLEHCSSTQKVLRVSSPWRPFAVHKMLPIDPLHLNCSYVFSSIANALLIALELTHSDFEAVVPNLCHRISHGKLHWDKYEFTRLARWLDHRPNVSLLQQNPTCVDPPMAQTNRSAHLVASILFRIKLRLPSPV